MIDASYCWLFDRYIDPYQCIYTPPVVQFICHYFVQCCWNKFLQYCHCKIALYIYCEYSITVVDFFADGYNECSPEIGSFVPHPARHKQCVSYTRSPVKDPTWI